jgi:hypothetical protein
VDQAGLQVVAADAGLGDRQALVPARDGGVEPTGVELGGSAAVRHADQRRMVLAEQAALDVPGARQQLARRARAARREVVVGEADQRAGGLEAAGSVQRLGQLQAALAVRQRGFVQAAVVVVAATDPREVDVLVTLGYARGQAGGDLQPALALVVARHADPSDVGEGGRGGEGPWVVAGLQGQARRLLQRLAGGRELTVLLERGAEREASLAEGRRVGGGRILLGSGEVDGGGVLAGGRERPHLRERLADALDAGGQRP